MGNATVSHPPLDVLCTDRGRHKALRFGGKPGEYENGALRVQCPGCGREVRLTAESFSRIVDAYSKIGRRELDVSALPF